VDAEMGNAPVNVPVEEEVASEEEA
jgi:hypothetical protein